MSRLELDCATAPADVNGDVFAILPSIDPLDPAQPQPYGSSACSGVVFEFYNPDEEALRGAWIQASGESTTSTDVFSESRCRERVLDADYWGYEKREWTKLGSASIVGRFEEDAVEAWAYCRVDAVIEHESMLEKLRVVARVSQDSETYPMYASPW